MKKVITEREIEKLAYEFVKLLIENYMWHDMRVFFNGRVVQTEAYSHPSNQSIEFIDSRGEKHIGYIEVNVSPHDYFDYAGDILSVSGECSLVEFTLYNQDFLAFDEKIHRKYGLYFEIGNLWNMSLYYV